MENFNRTPETNHDDFHLTEQMFKTDFNFHHNQPYDINFELITEDPPLNSNFNKDVLKPGHIIKVLTEENEKINALLYSLEANTNNLIKINNYNNSCETGNKLLSITEALLKAEIHHQKKEAVLFPELEKRGVVGAVLLLKLENEEIRRYTTDLKIIFANLNNQNYSVSIKKADALVKILLFKFREHIKKENFIIFPLSLKIIKELSTWDRIRNECIHPKG